MILFIIRRNIYIEICDFLSYITLRKNIWKKNNEKNKLTYYLIKLFLRYQLFDLIDTYIGLNI